MPGAVKVRPAGIVVVQLNQAVVHLDRAAAVIAAHPGRRHRIHHQVGRVVRHHILIVHLAGHTVVHREVLQAHQGIKCR